VGATDSRPTIARKISPSLPTASAVRGAGARQPCPAVETDRIRRRLRYRSVGLADGGGVCACVVLAFVFGRPGAASVGGVRVCVFHPSLARTIIIKSQPGICCNLRCRLRSMHRQSRTVRRSAREVEWVVQGFRTRSSVGFRLLFGASRWREGWDGPGWNTAKIVVRPHHRFRLQRLRDLPSICFHLQRIGRPVRILRGLKWETKQEEESPSCMDS